MCIIPGTSEHVMNSACPPDDELLALATDDAATSSVREHVDDCGRCQMRVKLLKAEIAELRSLSSPHADNLAKTVVPGLAHAKLPGGASISRYIIVGDL